MKIVTVVSASGGTGRTTVAAHLGAVLAQAGHGALVVDFDPQNAVGLWFGMEPGEHFGIARRGIAADELVRYVRRLRAEVPFLPFGACKLEELVAIEDEVAQRADWLRQRLEALTRGAFDYVIVDTPAGFGPFTRQALAHADIALAVLSPDAISYATIPMLQDVVADACEGRPLFRGVFYLLNQIDAKRPLQRDVRAAVLNLLQNAAVPVSLPLDESVREAVAHRRTLYHQNPDSPVLHGLRNVGAWLIDTLNESQSPTLIRG